jgi:hypothetical protein
MPYKLNIFTGSLDYYDSNFKGVLSSEPSNPAQGWTYINSGDNGYYIFYGSTWQLLHTLTPATQENVIFDGENVIFDGEQVKGQL